MGILDSLHITAEDIKPLNEYEQTKLLNKLLSYEFKNNKLALSGLTLSSNPKIADEGIDALIEISLPSGLDFIPEGFSIFQSKATPDFNVKKEFCRKNSDTEEWELKPLMKEYLEKGATYVLINTKKNYTPPQKEELKSKIKSLLDDFDYKLSFTVKIYSADDIARWCDKYNEFRLHFNKMEFAVNFDNWSEKIRKKLITDIIHTTDMDTIIWKIYSILKSSHESYEIIRIVGEYGIGKKTLLLESLDMLPEKVKSNIIFLDAKLNDADSINKSLHLFNVSSGILVIQNCSDKYHNEICHRLNALLLKDLQLVTLNSQTYIQVTKIYQDSNQ